MIELVARAAAFGDRTAIVGPAGTFTYSSLVAAAESVAGKLAAGKPSLDGERVAIMIPPGFDYVAVLWGVWIAGGIAVPLALTHPDPELEYVIADAAVGVVVGAKQFHARLAAVVAGTDCEVLLADRLVGAPSGAFTAADEAADAMLLYTSGTTGRPKGVVWRHSAIAAQVATLSTAWGWRADDRALLVLPLHHVHGLVNVVTTALWNGATIEMLPEFDVAATWRRLTSGELSVFMAVPTIYRRLLDLWDQLSADERAAARSRMSRMRLMVSGSAALPVATLEAWREASGHTLLERYGMTEIGMALSNPYEGDRVPGAVGAPLPGVEVRIVDEADNPVAAGVAGRLQVRGPSVFTRYWDRPEETRQSFVDGWFRTGDVAVARGGVFRIQGRESVDIIKTGGEKVSALEIEEVLRRHPVIVDCAVVGIADIEWGERVAAAITTRGEPPTLDEIRSFCGESLAPAKIPRALRVVGDLPRNALGKVIKPQVKDLFR